MRQGQQNRRGRGRGGRKPQNPLARNYESNGPDVKIRGTAAHIAEKYMSLARDALASGDLVSAESYLQHAEHYNRIIMAAQAQFGPQHGGQQGESPNGGIPQPALEFGRLRRRGRRVRDRTAAEISAPAGGGDMRAGAAAIFAAAAADRTASAMKAIASITAADASIRASWRQWPRGRARARCQRHRSARGASERRDRSRSGELGV